jgi:soluble cytochrome b562
MDIMTGLATASQAIKLANDLRGIDKAMNAAEFKLKIADLTVALSDIKMALSDAKQEIAEKDSEIADLKKRFKRTTELIEYQGFKYDKGTDDKPKGAPYCQVCDQKSGLLIHLADFGSVQNCPACNSKYSNVGFFGY